MARRLVVLLTGRAFLVGLISAMSLIADLSAEKTETVPTSDSIKVNTSADIRACKQAGGSRSTTYDYIGNELLSSKVQCSGGNVAGWWCVNTTSSATCSVPSLTQPPEQVAPGAGDTADSGRNPGCQTAVLEENTVPSDGTSEDPARGEGMTATTRATTDDVVLTCESLGGASTVDAH